MVFCGGAATAQEPAPPAEPQPEASDLGRKLVRKAVAESDEDIMEQIMRLMGESSRRLDVRFDAGDETQALQQQAIEKLDEAIKEAASQLRKKKMQPREKQQDKRKQQDPSRSQPEKSQRDAAQAYADPQSSEALDKGEAEETRLPGGELRDARRSWGLLPLRDRDEVIQGKNEASLERYRQMIERYFRMLQGTEEDKP